MGRIETDDLRDAERVYLATSLGEARRVEALLTKRGVDYAIEVEALGRTTLFGSIRHAAAVYVTASQAEYCRHALAQDGFPDGLVHGDDEQDEPR
jgi:hypothetical protein